MKIGLETESSFIFSERIDGHIWIYQKNCRARTRWCNDKFKCTTLFFPNKGIMASFKDLNWASYMLGVVI